MDPTPKGQNMNKDRYKVFNWELLEKLAVEYRYTKEYGALSMHMWSYHHDNIGQTKEQTMVMTILTMAGIIKQLADPEKWERETAEMQKQFAEWDKEYETKQSE
jgi:hypothetical protein